MDSTQNELVGSASIGTDDEHQMYAPARILDDDSGFTLDCAYVELGANMVSRGRDTCSNAMKHVSVSATRGHSESMNTSTVWGIELCPNTLEKEETEQLYSYHDDGLPNNFSMDQMDFEPDNPCDYTPNNGEHIMGYHVATPGTPQQVTTPSSHPRVVQTPQGPALLLTTSMTAPVPQVPSPLAHHRGNAQHRKFQRWCDNEDAILRYAVSCDDEARPNWRKISKNFFAGSRSPLQCKSRWTKSLQPGIVIGNWQEHEDTTIRQLREAGARWSHIAEQLPGRIAEHIRDRYVNFLDPDLKKTPWTKSEDQILYQQQKLHGNKWTTIAKSLPGRSENAVKNRWHNAKMTQRRRMRRHALERTLESRSLRARQHVENPYPEDDSLADVNQTETVDV